MGLQTSCVFAQLTGQWVLRMLHDLHRSMRNADTRAHIWKTRAVKTGIWIVTYLTPAGSESSGQKYNFFIFNFFYFNELLHFIRQMVATPVSQGCANPAGCSYHKNEALGFGAAALTRLAEKKNPKLHLNTARLDGGSAPAHRIAAYMGMRLILAGEVGKRKLYPEKQTKPTWGSRNLPSRQKRCWNQHFFGHARERLQNATSNGRSWAFARELDLRSLI